jgi:hypothetical protein
MRRIVLLAAASTLVTVLTACSSTPRPAAGTTVQTQYPSATAAPVTPAGYQSRLSVFGDAKDCKT